MNRGFYFKSSENLTSEKSEIKLYFTDINCENGTANCKILANPFLINSSNNTSVLLLLQIPFKISNVTIKYQNGAPSDFGGNNLTLSAKNMSYIFVSLPKNNNHVSEHFEDAGHFTLTYRFTVESAFTKINSYTYEFPITWGGGLNNVYREFDFLINIYPDLHWQLHFFIASNALLRVERSSQYYYSEVLPRLDTIEVIENITSYCWDLKEVGAKGRESSIIIEIMNLSTKSRYDLNYSLVWLSLGVGIPTIISGLIEFLKNKGNLKSLNFWKNASISILSGFLTGFVTYHLMYLLVIG